MPLQGKYTPPKKDQQLSKEALRERIRPYALKAIETTLELMEHAPNDSVRLGAAKLLLSKVLPDLKATELTGDETKALVVKILGYGEKESSNN